MGAVGESGVGGDFVKGAAGVGRSVERVGRPFAGTAGDALGVGSRSSEAGRPKSGATSAGTMTTGRAACTDWRFGMWCPNDPQPVLAEVGVVGVPGGEMERVECDDEGEDEPR